MKTQGVAQNEGQRGKRANVAGGERFQNNTGGSTIHQTPGWGEGGSRTHLRQGNVSPGGRKIWDDTSGEKSHRGDNVGGRGRKKNWEMNRSQKVTKIRGREKGVG